MVASDEDGKSVLGGWLAPHREIYKFYAVLCEAYGWRYVAIASAVYGITEGLSEPFLYDAEQYYLFDNLGLSAATFTQVAGEFFFMFALTFCSRLCGDSLAN